ncbi:hypothetical protein MMC32_006872 [Xylographa parallela]|nr:hypothetical protein [Xylographa parallela]
MRPPRPLLHAHLLLLLFLAVLASPYIANVPVCSAPYGPTDNDDATRALRFLSAPFEATNNPLPQHPVQLPRYYKFASVLVGLDFMRMDPVTAMAYAHGVTPAWKWHLQNLVTLKSACVSFQGYQPRMREQGGWMQSHGFFYVVVNALAVGDVDACLREPGMLFESCVARGVHYNWLAHQQVISAAQAPAPMDTDADEEEHVDVQALADSLLQGMY